MQGAKRLTGRTQVEQPMCRHVRGKAIHRQAKLLTRRM